MPSKSSPRRPRPTPVITKGMGQSESVELLPLGRVRSCIVCLGSTGAGKSSTVGRVTLKHAPSSAGLERQTSKCAVYEDDEAGHVWIDTVGWEDRHQEDETSFQEIMTFIKDNNFTSIAAVVWNVIPNVRRDAVLTRQAKLINLLADGIIWNNVIIVCKQSMKPDRDGAGAVRTAQEFNPNARPQVVGYRFFTDLDDDQKEKLVNNPELRASFNVRTDAEVREVIMDAVQKCGEPLPIVFRNLKCMDCGQVGDPRLMPFYCHMESHHVHPRGVAIVHPLPIENYHESDVQIAEHVGRLQSPWFVQLGLSKGKRYSCCGKKAGKSGCTVKWACCKQIVDEYTTDENGGSGCKRWYGCCKRDPTNAGDGCEPRHVCCGRRTTDLGCVELCRKCEQPWGTNTNNCFKKEHNLTEKWSSVIENGEDVFGPEDPYNNNKDVKMVFGLPPIIIAKPF